MEKALSTTEDVTVWGSGNQTRSFIHATDLVYGIMLVSERDTVVDSVNIGIHTEVPIHQLADYLMRLSKISKPVIRDESEPEGAVRKGADITKLRSIAPEFHHSIPWEAGLAELVETAVAFWASTVTK